eukprot:jgi/Hompol1/2798/HPOL_006164-RA
MPHIGQAVMLRSIDPSKDDRVLSSQYLSNINRNNAISVRETYNKGLFSRFEKDQVQQAVSDYLRENNIPEADLHYLIRRRTKVQDVDGSKSQYADKQYAGFVQNIRDRSRVNRSCDQLYWYLARAYANNRTNNRRWTPEQDKQLVDLVALKGQKWSEIERQIGMSDAKARYKKLLAITGKKQSGKWSAEEEQKLLEGVREIMEREGMTDAHQFNRWSELAAYMVTRSDVQCRAKWASELKHAASSSKTNTASISLPVRQFLRDDHVALLTRMLAFCSTAGDESEVLWNSLVMPGEPWTGPFLRARWADLKNACAASRTVGMTFQGEIAFLT